MYLHDWAESEFFGMVMDFEGVFCTKAEYEAAQSPYSNHDMWIESKAKAKAAIEDPKYQGLDVLFASYCQGNYSGDAFVLFRKDGKLYEVNGGHCSCYGLEGQWDPEETSIEALRKRLDDGSLGAYDYCGNVFADELRAALDGVSS